MATLDRGLLRKLADWSSAHPVTTLHLDVDGRRHPSREDYLVRMEDAMKRVDLRRWEKDDRRSICADLEAIRGYVHDEFDRSGVGGLAMFSSTGAGLWEVVPLPQPLRDRLEVGARPLLIPLEAMLERMETFCVTVSDREHARILYVEHGRVEEVSDLFDEVPGWHDRGGWAQARFQRHIKDHVQRHLKRVAEAVFHASRRRPFDHLILAGADDLVAALERELHDYVARRIVGRVALPITVSPAEVLARAQEVEGRLQARREAEALERLAGEVPAGRAVAGLAATLEALQAGRVETLLVSPDLRAEGRRCPSCGHLALSGDRCPACTAATIPADQLVEEVVESALRRRCRVETVAGAPSLDPMGGIGALLRF